MSLMFAFLWADAPEVLKEQAKAVIWRKMFDENGEPPKAVLLFDYCDEEWLKREYLKENPVATRVLTDYLKFPDQAILDLIPSTAQPYAWSMFVLLCAW